MKSNSRVAYHAGSWYKDDPSLLAKEIAGYLSKSEKLDQYQSLKSIIDYINYLEESSNTFSKEEPKSSNTKIL